MTRRVAPSLVLLRLALLPVVLLGGCAPGGLFDRMFASAPAPPPEMIHYVVGDPYQIGGVWRYPRADFTYNDTGLAAIAGDDHAPLTTDGERFDPTAMAAGHRTLQLPAIARVTNLDTGRSVLVRVNDRAPASPARLIEITPRVAQLIGAADGSRVQVEVIEADSRRLAAQLDTASHIAVATVPAGDVQAEALAPPAGAAASKRGRTAPPPQMPPAATEAAIDGPPVPTRLPEQVTQGSVIGGILFIEAGRFSRLEYARFMQDRLVEFGATLTADYAAPSDQAFVVRLGPYPDVHAAEAALDRALAAGVADARIIVGP